MALYFSENFWKDNDGPTYTVYATAVMGNTNFYEGDPDTVYSLSPQGQWSWNPSMSASYVPAIQATKLSYTGLTGLGSKKLLFWARGDGTHYSYLYRSTFGTPITNTAKSIWVALLTSCYNNKEIVTWKFTKLTSDSAGNTPVAFLNWTAANPAVCRAGAGTTTLYTGDSSFTTRLIMAKITMDGTATHTVTIDYYVDPDLSVAPASWTKAATISTYYWGSGGGVDDIKLDSGRNSTSIDSRMYFDCFRIADEWYEAVGLSSDPTVTKGKSNFMQFFKKGI